MTEHVKVLLVDDEEELTQYMQKRLSTRGFHVDVLHSGEEALKYLEEKKADVVVLDILMPGMDGTATLEKIKADHPAIEVIMLTGHGTVETAVKGLKKGAFDYLLKPTDLDELSDKIQKAHEKKHKADIDKLNEKINNAILTHGKH